MTLLNKNLSKKNQVIATMLAFAIIPISGLATDIYLPSMPQMAISLGLPEAKVQLTLAIFLVSYGISQFFTGALVDAFGRYKVTLLSLLIFVVSFWFTANSNNIYFIYLMRVVQGILCGVVAVSKRAFFVDIYEGEKRKHYLSIMTIVWSIAPIIAPFIGGYLESIFGWQSNFIFLAGYCGLLFVLELLFSGETIQQKNPFKIGFLFTEYKKMFRTLDFSYGVLMCGISYSLVMFYNLCGPFIIEHEFGFSPITTGYISLMMGFAWMCGSFLGKAMINKAFLPKLRNANFWQLGFVALMFITSYYIQNLYTLAGFAFIIHLTAGFIFNNYFSYCIGRFPQYAGISGGLTGGGGFVLTSIISYSAVAIIKPFSQSMVATGYFVMAVLGFLMLLLIKLKKAYV